MLQSGFTAVGRHFHFSSLLHTSNSLVKLAAPNQSEWLCSRSRFCLFPKAERLPLQIPHQLEITQAGTDKRLRQVQQIGQSGTESQPRPPLCLDLNKNKRKKKKSDWGRNAPQVTVPSRSSLTAVSQRMDGWMEERQGLFGRGHIGSAKHSEVTGDRRGQRTRRPPREAPPSECDSQRRFSASISRPVSPASTCLLWTWC